MGIGTSALRRSGNRAVFGAVFGVASEALLGLCLRSESVPLDFHSPLDEILDIGQGRLHEVHVFAFGWPFGSKGSDALAESIKPFAQTPAQRVRIGHAVEVAIIATVYIRTTARADDARQRSRDHVQQRL